MTLALFSGIDLCRLWRWKSSTLITFVYNPKHIPNLNIYHLQFSKGWSDFDGILHRYNLTINGLDFLQVEHLPLTDLTDFPLVEHLPLTDLTDFPLVEHLPLTDLTWFSTGLTLTLDWLDFPQVEHLPLTDLIFHWLNTYHWLTWFSTGWTFNVDRLG